MLIAGHCRLKPPIKDVIQLLQGGAVPVNRRSQ
jgi:hypothetical protein